MTGLQLYRHERFGKIRALERNGDPWFVGKDAADALGYANGSRDVNRHVDPEDRQNYRDGTLEKSNRGLTIINESGLYSLIFSSKLEGAKAFKHWVTSEVLPSIRKHGAYMTPDTVDKVIADPDFGIRLLNQLKQEREERQKLEAANAQLHEKNRELLPKAEYFEELVDRNQLTSIRQTAKMLCWQERSFVAFMLEHGYLYRDHKQRLHPYAEMVTRGFFVIKEYVHEITGHIGTQVLITASGRMHFLQKSKAA